MVHSTKQICANRPKRGKNRPKSAVFRKWVRFFLPTFALQKRAKAHFFWPFFSEILRTLVNFLRKFMKNVSLPTFQILKMGRNIINFRTSDIAVHSVNATIRIEPVRITVFEFIYIQSQNCLQTNTDSVSTYCKIPRNISEFFHKVLIIQLMIFLLSGSVIKASSSR